MAKFFNSDLSDLTHQLTLSPRRLRMEQIHAIETLLSMVEPSRAYPYEFICHRITKYQKHGGSDASALVPGKALIGDLVTMAEVLSRKANLAVVELYEQFKLHQEAAEELHVSTKTVRRWRSRGLMGIRVVCEDGVNRLVFLRSTLDRFVEQNQELVAKGAAFRQLTQIERDHLVDRAREILSAKTLKLHTIARTIAEETGRAVETIRYTLRRYDESNPETALFTGPPMSAACRREEAIWQCREA
ncbi:MAG: helix-turn-helix domain-containing protein, partial [Planctomycetes bacterium]|nr:helix-turn-helix domain-containing protein [Planctomycetota bacterium]